jgi:hypothetical protein
VYEEETRFQDLFLAMVREHDTAGGLFLKYKTEYPESSDEEAQMFVIQEWRALSVVLNVPIDVWINWTMADPVPVRAPFWKQLLLAPNSPFRADSGQAHGSSRTLLEGLLSWAFPVTHATEFW